MNFDDIELVSEKQIVFCRKLGLDVSGNSVSVAAAKINEVIQRQFWGSPINESPTDKQISLAKKFGIDISHMSRLVGDAVINDIMTQLNANAIKEQGLRPGLRVRKVYDKTSREYIISSIRPDGTVYFKGGNGQRAWARNLVSLEKA
ncbi:MAG: hypothetical protein ABIF87_12580 [Pseudomonadota bacterium]